jgi:hypothetical protein
LLADRLFPQAVGASHPQAPTSGWPRSTGWRCCAPTGHRRRCWSAGTGPRCCWPPPGSGCARYQRYRQVTRLGSRCRRAGRGWPWRNHRRQIGRITRDKLCRGRGEPSSSVPQRDARGGLWHYVAVAPKQSKLAMATARSGRDNRSITLRQQGKSRTVSAAGPHWTPSRSRPWPG